MNVHDNLEQPCSQAVGKSAVFTGCPSAKIVDIGHVSYELPHLHLVIGFEDLSALVAGEKSCVLLTVRRI